MFSRELVQFLTELKSNNNKAWFNENKARYETQVRQPALAFIEDFAPRLIALSPHFDASAKKVGGSMMRIYKDVRFAKDKTPYKTNVGIQFRHSRGRDVHAPGFYLHIEPGNCFLGTGIWRPESKALAKIRDCIDNNPKAFIKATENEDFLSFYCLDGETLIRPPRGYAKDHPMITAIKRKDFIAIGQFPEEYLYQDNLLELVQAQYQKALPLMSYLCYALDLDC